MEINKIQTDKEPEISLKEEIEEEAKAKVQTKKKVIEEITNLNKDISDRRRTLAYFYPLSMLIIVIILLIRFCLKAFEFQKFFE